ncbi:MAG: hypothetical protein AB8F95_04755 [Bacteroidia bacterium]
MKKLSLLIFILFLGLLVFGQKEKKSSGEYQLNLTRSELSEAQACEKCKELARVQAIEKVFGTVIVQGNATMIKNTQTGETVETEQTFSMIAETYVNGDWIKTIKESCERFVENDEFWVKCSVRGVVRELIAPEIDLEIQTLGCPETTCNKIHFNDGDPFYLSIEAPVKGYLTVYLADDQVSQRVFPYRNMPESQVNGVEIPADKPCVLFSRAADMLGLGAYVDEYDLYAESPKDINRVFIVWTPEPLVKPRLQTAKTDGQGENMPLELSFTDFQKWLSQNRRYQTGMIVKRVDITIEK